MIKWVDTFLLERLYTPAVHFVDRWLHLNQYRQAWYLMSYAAVGLIVSFAQDFIKHEYQNWFMYGLFCLMLAVYIAMTNELHKLGNRYETAPWEVMKIYWMRSGPIFRLFCMTLDLLDLPLHITYDHGGLVYWFLLTTHFAFTAAWYAVLVKRPNKPRFQYSLGKLAFHGS